LGDHPEIFGNDGDLAKFLPDLFKQFLSRTRDPFPVDGSLLTIGNGPIGSKTPEVVDPDDIVKYQV